MSSPLHLPGAAPSPSSRRLTALVIALAVLLRVGPMGYGLDFEDPARAIHNVHVDERGMVTEVLGLMRGDWDPGVFQMRGTTPFYAAGLVDAAVLGSLALVRGESWDTTVDRYEANPSLVFLVHRLLATLTGVLTVWVLLRLVSRELDPATGLVAGLFLAASHMHAHLSALGLVDVPWVLFALLAVDRAARIVDRPVRANYVLAGVWIGVAGATKYPGALIGLAVLVAHLFVRRDARRRGEAAPAWRLFATAALTSLVVFLLLNPRLFLATADNLAMMRRQFEILDIGQVDTSYVAVLYRHLQSLARGLGEPVLLLAAIGLVAALRAGGRPRRIAALALCLVPTAFIAQLPAPRFATGFLVAVALLAAQGFAAVTARAPRPVRALVLVLVLLPTLVRTIATDLVLRRPDTRPEMVAEIATRGLAPDEVLGVGHRGLPQTHGQPEPYVGADARAAEPQDHAAGGRRRSAALDPARPLLRDGSRGRHLGTLRRARGARIRGGPATGRAPRPGGRALAAGGLPRDPLLRPLRHALGGPAPGPRAGAVPAPGGRGGAALAPRAGVCWPSRMAANEETVGFEGGSGDTTADFTAAVQARLAARSGAYGRYELREEVARGGQGAVLRVWDQDLRRDLAMKVVLEEGERSGSGSDAKTIGRFLEEAQVTGQLDHPGIVPVHELGLDADGRVYFTMKLVKGQDLDDVFDLIRNENEGWTRTRALHVLLKVCEAMAYAHSKQVIHRDLKPANIMVGRFGEAYVMDWGLAKVIGTEDRLDLRIRPADVAPRSVIRSERQEESGGAGLVTMDGDVVGTPAYMSPEQASGDLAAMGPASDVYSLGAILYHLLAGHAPYVPRGARMNAYVVWGLVQNGPPNPIASIARDAPAELVAICEKAMARDPAQRYADTGELAADLRAFLEDRVVRAYRSGPLVELGMWVRRNRALAWSVAALLVVAVGGSSTAALVLNQKNREVREARDAAVAAKELADAAAANEARLRSEAEYARSASERVTNFLVGQFESLEPDTVRGTEIGVEELLGRARDALERDMNGRSVESACLRAVVGGAYYALGSYSDAEPLLVRALQDRRALLGEDDPATLASMDDLAVLFEIMGRYDEAEPLQDEAYRGRLALLGPDHPDTLTSMSHLAYLYESMGREGEAEPLYAEALEKRRAVLGSDHPDTLISQDDLGLLYELQGRYDEAEALLVDALARFRATLGDDHPSTLTALNDLAVLYGSQQRYAESEGLYDRLIELSREVLGPDHPDTLDSLDNLAGLYRDQGRLDEALGLYRDVVERSRQVLGPDHPDTLVTQGHLAQTYAAADAPAQAEPLFLECLAARRAVFGDEHDATLDLMTDLARFYADQERWDAALPLAEEALGESPPDSSDREDREALLERIRNRAPG